MKERATANTDLEAHTSGDRGAAGELARLQASMGRLSRQIGERRRQGQEATALIAQMRELSRRRKVLQARPHAAAGATATGGDRAGTARATAPEPAPAGYPDAALPAGAVGIDDPLCGAPAAAEWDRYVAAHPRGSLYHCHCWKDIVSTSFGHATFWLAARRSNGALAGVLPLVQQRSRLFGHYLTSLPFVTYGGALGDSPDVEQCLMQRAGALAGTLGARHVEFRDAVPRVGWPVRTDKVSMRLALPDSAEALWSTFTPKLRAQIRRGQREQPVTTFGGRELVPDFHRVFSRNMRDLGTPVYPRRFFDVMLERITAPARVLVVYLGSQPVAAGIIVGHRGLMEIPWASSLRAVNTLGINMHLYWAVLQHAIAEGYVTFDFGRSTAGAGTYRFKRQWGAKPMPLHWHYWLNDGAEVPQLNPDNPRYRLAIAGWRRLPVWLANQLGPPIVRYLP